VRLLRVSLVARVTARRLHNNMLGVYRCMVSGHEISRLQHDLSCNYARYTRIIHSRPCSCCNLYIRYEHNLLYSDVARKCIG